MNEIQLKDRFLEFLNLNPKNNFFGNTSNRNERYIEIKNEALNRKFDFILAVCKTKNIKTKDIRDSTIEMDDDLRNIYVRSTLLKTISDNYKMNVDKITLYPIEIKSDRDKLDDRLANQVIEAILSFGRSIVILDSKHSSKIIKNGLARILPSTLIGYFDESDEFAVINRHDRVYSDSLLNVNKLHLIKTLEKADNQINVTKLYNNLRRLQSIHQKLIYNQIFKKGQCLLEDEVIFMKELSSLNQKINVKKEIIKTIQQYKNYKITDFTE
ncbi:hypothetical protein BH23THE1_BH23THE1_15170 [soil metagenome]